MSSDGTEARPHILVVEDDGTIALGVVRALEMDGYEVSHASTGEQALEIAAEREPDLVLLDWMLPGIDGLEVLQQLKAQQGHVPVIMLTARISEQDRVRGLDAGADDYVIKPFSLKELAARVRARMRSRARMQESGAWVEFGNVRVDLPHRILEKAGVESRLTTHEAGVLDDAQVLALEQGHGSESFALGGTLHGGGPVHARLHLLRALLLRLPAPLNRLILRRRLYRLMPESVPLLRGLLRLAEAARGQDINAQRYVGKYVHFLSRALATRSGKTRSSSK